MRWLAFLFLAMGVNSAAIAQSQDDVYRLIAGDQITVSVLEDPGLNTTVLVRPDGRISLPLAGTLQAEGLTPEALQAAIRRALAGSFIEAPTVTVSLVGLGEDAELARTIYVLGQVGSPGAVPLEKGRSVDLLQALALVGGPGPFAATDRIQVRRQTAAGGEEVMFFDYRVVEDGATPSRRILLRDGDVIVVPERGLFD